jgi:hypothetical protein
MKESVLKKEFKEADLQRLRNLVQGKTGEKTSVSSGYTKETIDRQEGEIWEEDGRQWTIKGGIKQSISKLQKARDLGKMPLFCPECKTLMKNRFDAQFYNIHHHCFDCQIKFETKLKVTGKWEEYHDGIHNSEIDAMINNFEIWTEDLMKESNDGFISEAGELENWSKVNKEKILKQKEEAIEYFKKLKK